MTFAADTAAAAHQEHANDTSPTDYMGVTAPNPDELAAGVEGPWRVDGDRTAAWALRRIAEHQAEIGRVIVAAAADISAVKAWEADATRAPRRSIEFFEAALIDYRHRMEAENPKLPSTYKLPGGNLTRRAGRVRFTVVDEDALLAWAEQNAPDVIARRALVSPLKSDDYTVVIDDDGEPAGPVVTADGEVVPGVRVHVPRDTYGVVLRAETSPVEP